MRRFPWCDQRCTFYTQHGWVGNGHLCGKTRSKSRYSWTGDDRNAYRITAAGSRNVSAMECCESDVRAILTVSIIILASPTSVFKAVIL